MEPLAACAQAPGPGPSCLPSLSPLCSGPSSRAILNPLPQPLVPMEGCDPSPPFLPGGLLLRHLSLHHADHPVLPWSDAARSQGGNPLLHHAQLPQAVRLRGERFSWPHLLAFLEGARPAGQGAPGALQPRGAQSARTFLWQSWVSGTSRLFVFLFL